MNRRAKHKDETAAERGYGVDFSKDEIEGEARRPKKKVAVMIGYSGSGYRGIQL